MRTLQWIIFKILLYFELIREVTAVYCRYETSTGNVEHMFCLHKCCEGRDKYSEGSICCSFERSHEVFIGAGMASLIVIAVFGICFLYICCKQRIMQQARRYDQRHQNTRVRRSPGSRCRPDVEDIPTISSQIEPVLPPPYDALPPPYSQIEKDSKTDEDKSLPFGPPPEYSVRDLSLP